MFSFKEVFIAGFNLIDQLVICKSFPWSSECAMSKAINTQSGRPNPPHFMIESGGAACFLASLTSTHRDGDVVFAPVNQN